MIALPIDPAVPRIVAALRDATALSISSPPGSGKTTRVPPALLEVFDGEVLVLEPRRIAARAAARRVATEIGVELGAEVGFEVRDDRRVSSRTRLRFLTEGVLVQRVARDPYLEGVAAVVLDEFHERHVETDLALAMLREVRDTVRPELRIVVMSATLDVDPVRAFLAPCEHVAAEGALHDVRIEHIDRTAGEEVLERVPHGVQRALDETDGDVLVFLPGMGAILRAQRNLEGLARRRDLELLLLHGALGADEQDRALRPCARRKVVLATNVAESSLTIDGVRAVVDTGLARVVRHDTARGLDSLRTESISRASAEQRAGRAGRTGPGTCFRLWSRADERAMPPFDTAEIRRVDLAGPALLVRVFAGSDPRSFGWFEAPDAAAFERADELLFALGLIDSAGRVTDDGERALRLPVHPRLGRMLCEARRRGCVAAVAEIAALLSEREPRRGSSADLGTLIESMRMQEPSLARAVSRGRDRLVRTMRSGSGIDDQTDVGRCVLAGFADRVVRCDGDGKGQLASGRGVRFDDPAFADAELLVALRVSETGSGARSRLQLALPIERAWLEDVFPGSVHVVRSARFDPSTGHAFAVTQTRFRDIVLEEQRGGRADPGAIEDLLAEEVRRDPLKHLGDTRKLEGFLARVAWLRGAMPDAGLPKFDAAAVADAAAQLAPGKRSLKDFKNAPVLDLLDAQLSPQQRAILRREAPDRIALVSGRELRIDYDPEPHIAARLQEFFGTPDTPRLAGGRVPVQLQLLAPNQRPVQITSDLASFWATIYPKVRSELRNRYPKHAWPEDPLTAKPSRPGRRR